MMIEPNLFDIVEILQPLPALHLSAGTQGVLVEQYDAQAFQVEFSDEEGRTIGVCPLMRHQFIVVWQASVEQEVSPPEQVAQMMAFLPTTAEQEILDFARFLSWRQYPILAFAEPA